jgi:hypothetical protein
MRHAGSTRSRLWLTFAAVFALGLAACVPLGGAHGTLAADVVVGPVCPVQSTQNPCPSQPVPNRQVAIQTPAGATVTTRTTDSQGHLTVDLAPGHYVVRVAIIPGQPGVRQTTPGDVTITAGQTTHLTIELDSGVR